MNKALFALAFVISLTGLNAEESQVPFKVGDIVTLIPMDTGTEKKPCRMIFEVKEIKGKWVSSATLQLPKRPRSLSSSTNSNSTNISEPESWYNTEAYSRVLVNDPEIVKMVKEGITPEGWTRPPNIRTNGVTKNTAIQKPGQAEEPKPEEESK
jgi:hypothetical protein